jgi:hypothetical protein
MGKCCLYCSYPQLPVDASQHRCANCGNKFHGLCSNVRHPRADELQLTMGNDHLCPCCARSIGANFVPSLGSDSPCSVESSGSSNDSSLSESTQRLLSLANNNTNHSIGVQQPNVIVEASGRKNQQQLVYHSLPPGVEVHNSSATDGLKCHFTKQSKCKFKNTEIVNCIRCENAVHVQCFLHLILDSKDNKVSIDAITCSADIYFISNLNNIFS